MEDRRDDDLISEVLAGDHRAYAEIVARYQDKVFTTVSWLCRDRDEAEDLTQEVFVRAYFALPTHDRSRQLSPWLITIARNLYFSRCRKRRRQAYLDDPGSGARTIADDRPSPHALAEAGDTVRRLKQAVAELPEEYREIVLMRHVAELSYDEICTATGLPMGTVKSRLNRGRRMLAKAMEQERG